MTIRDPEVLEALRDEPELLAIADAVVETQPSARHSRRAPAPYVPREAERAGLRGGGGTPPRRRARIPRVPDGRPKRGRRPDSRDVRPGAGALAPVRPAPRECAHLALPARALDGARPLPRGGRAGGVARVAGRRTSRRPARPSSAKACRPSSSGRCRGCPQPSARSWRCGSCSSWTARARAACSGSARRRARRASAARCRSWRRRWAQMSPLELVDDRFGDLARELRAAAPGRVAAASRARARARAAPEALRGQLPDARSGRRAGDARREPRRGRWARSAARCEWASAGAADPAAEGGASAPEDSAHAAGLQG